MNRVLRWLAASFGYLLYTAMVLVLLLWVLLPTDSLRPWLEARLNAASPGLRWEIKELHAALPAGLVVIGMRLQEAGASEDELLQVSEMRIMPDLRGLIATRKELPFRYQLKVADGALQGKAALLKDGSKLRCEGEAKNIQLGGLATLWARLDRNATGKLSGNYRFEGEWRDPYQGVFTAELRVVEGSFTLQQPVFGLDQLEFGQLTGSLELRERLLALNHGKVDSRLLAGEYSGSVTLADPLQLSEVKIDGTFEPRPELLSSLRNETTVTLIRKQLRDNKLSFSLNGTILEPGIEFQGVSGVIDGIIQGGER
ncbi:MAG TPA: type II secretion system protein GspN [Desulfobulbaceae bacterium]|nr:type II secretion system protein GspN [Desulfobulbaceae bacterium]